MEKKAGLILALIAVLAAAPALTVGAQTTASCKSCPVASVKATASQALGPSDTSQGCSTQTKEGFPVPDPKCTPGAINPTVTLAVLKDSAFRTACIRDCVTSEAEKSDTYGLYGIPHPKDNEGANQTCELDHLVPLELGGADTLNNIWPQCGPNSVTLAKRYFKQKDMVEDYLAGQVKAGKMDLAKAQSEIATDWPQFLSEASDFCAKNPKQCGSGEN